MTIIKKQWFKNNSNTSNNGNVKCKNARFSNDNSDILINELSLLHELQFTSYCILHELLFYKFFVSFIINPFFIMMNVLEIWFAETLQNN